MNASLLDPALVRELEAMRRRLSLRASSGAPGERRARVRGTGHEFAEHRPYAPGDDLRRVDSLAWARVGEPVTKTFRAEEDVLVRLVVDTSASLEGPKLARALRLAAAFGYLGLASGERAQVIPFADAVSAPTPPVRGRNALPALLHTLGSLRAQGRTGLARAVDVALSSGRPGWLVIVSDFLDPEGFEGPLTRALAAGHDLAIVQVIEPEEIDPTLDGDLLLEDSETGETVTFTADAEALEGYRQRLGALFASLASLARRRRGTYVRSRTDEPIELAVRRVLERRIDEP